MSGTAGARRASRPLRSLWEATPLGRFRPSAASDLRVHLLVLGLMVLTLGTALQRMVSYWQVSEAIPTDLLWPVAWARGLDWPTVAVWLTVAFTASALAAAVGYRHRPLRLLLAVLVVVLVAALGSFGKINHGLHHLVYATVVVAFVPTLTRPTTAGDPRVPRRAYDVIAAAQGLVLVTYTLSGATKLLAGIAQLRAGEPSMFASGSLGRLVADRMLQTGETPPLATVLIEHPTSGALLFGVTVLVELLAVAVLPFPRLAALWAALLAAFHLAVFWAMHINFSVSVAVLVLLFGVSPFLVPTEDPGDPEGPGPAGSLPGSDHRPATG